jgi:UDP-glucose 4-epimerase
MLVRRGDRVRALVHRSEPDLDGLERVFGDLAEPERFASALGGADAVVHCAALLDPIADETEADRVNHRASVELARLAARAGVRSFVFLSSLAAVGYHPGSGLVRPGARCRPTTAYGRSKLAAERALSAAELPELRRVLLRTPTVYGAGERANFLALTRAIDTGMFPIPGSGDNRMSFCYAENLAAAVCFALDEPRASGVLHVADEPPLTFRGAVQTIASALGRRVLPLPFPLPVARAVALACEASFGAIGRNPPLSRARLTTLSADCALDTSETAALGFRPKTAFADGVRETIEHYRSAGLLRRQ